MNTIDLFSRTLDQTQAIVDNVGDDQLDLSTPCADWNVRTVIAHLVRGNENAVAAAKGRPRQPTPIADVNGDPREAYRASVAAVKEAWDEERLDEEYQTALGPLPGRALLTLRIADSVTHGWDLARATGQIPHYDDDIVQAAQAFADAQFGAGRPPGGPFAPPVTVSDDLPPIDRLAAFLGRQP